MFSLFECCLCSVVSTSSVVSMVSIRSIVSTVSVDSKCLYGFYGFIVSILVWLCSCFVFRNLLPVFGDGTVYVVCGETNSLDN
jgi:hypothetical protein